MNSINIIITPNTTMEQVQESFIKCSQNTKLHLSLDILSDQEQRMIKLVEENLGLFNRLVQLNIIIQQQCILENEDYQSLAKGISHLKKLVQLSIIIEDQCQISSEGLISLTKGIQQLNELQEIELLFLKNNNISYNGIKNLSECIQKLPNLKKISIQIDCNNQFCSKGLSALCEGLEKSQYLEDLKLNLDLTRILDTGLATLGETLKKLQNIIKLQLIFESQIGKISGIKNLLNSLTSLINMKSLSMHSYSHQKLSIEDENSFSNSFNQLIQLENLKINGLLENLSQDCYVDFFNALSKLSQLRTLSLDIYQSSQNIQKQSSMFGDSFKQFQLLNTLQLFIRGNQINQDEDIKQIAESLQYMNNLKKLELGFWNKVIVSEDCFVLMHSLRYLQDLEELKLNITNGFDLRRDSAIQFGESLKLMKNIKVLEIIESIDDIKCQYNQIIFESLQYLQKLEVLNLYLSNNQEEDSLVEFGKAIQDLNLLKSLKIEFNCSENLNQQSMIAISEALSNFSQLETLQLYLYGLQTGNEEIMLSFFNKGFKNLKILKEFKLNFDIQFTVQLSKEFSDALSNLENLENFELNILQDMTFTHLALILRGLSNSKLKKLNLQLPNIISQENENLEQIQNMFINLSHLEEFKIKSYSEFSGKNQFQIFVNSLKNIKSITDLELNLPYVSVTDQDLATLRDCFYNLQNLLNLNLYSPRLDMNVTKEGIFTLNQGLSSLKKLKNFFGTFQNSNSEVQQILQSTQKLKNIRQIFLGMFNMNFYQNATENQKNKDDSTLVACKPSQELECKKLVSLTLNLSQLIQSKQILIDFFKNLNQLQSLTYLQIFIESLYIISNQEISALGGSLQHLNRLSELYIQFNSSNNLNEQSLTDLGNGIQKLNLLDSLTIHVSKETKLDSNGLSNLMKSLRYLKNLLSLNLYFFQKIEQQSFIILGESFEQMDQLKQLNLAIGENEEQFGQGALSIGKGLQHSKNLLTLFLKFGDSLNIGYEGASQIAQSLSQLKQLQLLSLDFGQNCNLTNQGCQEISQNLLHLKNLSHLYIYIKQGNGLKSDVTQQLIQELTLLKNLSQTIFQVSIDEILKQTPIQIQELFMAKNIQQIKLTFQKQNENIKTIIHEFQKHFDFKLTFENSQQSDNFENISQIVQSIPEKIKIYVKFSYQCDLTQQNYQMFAQQLALLKSQELDLTFLGENEIGSNIMEIAEGIQKQKNLISLTLNVGRSNGIIKELALNLQNSLSKLNQIKQLNISISCQEDFALPDYIQFLRKLSTIQKLRYFSFSIDGYTHNTKFRHQIFYKLNKRLVNLVVNQY